MQRNDFAAERPYTTVTVFHRSSFYRCKHSIHSNVKIVQNERKRRIVMDSDEDDWLWLFFVNFVQFSINFDSFKRLDPYFVIKKVVFDRQKTLSRILESDTVTKRFWSFV